jgi:fatty acid desaturase
MTRGEPRTLLHPAAMDPPPATVAIAHPESIERLGGRAFARWITAVVCDWSVIAGALWLAVVAPPPWGIVLAVVIVGTRQHALAVLMHEAVHDLVAARRATNDRLANLLCAWPVGLDVQRYRRFHVGHHRATGTEADPELLFKRMTGPEWDLPVPFRRVLLRLLQDLLGRGAWLQMEMVLSYGPRGRERWMRFAGWWCVLVLIALLTGHGALVLGVWLGAGLTVLPAALRLRLWAEHSATPGTNRYAPAWALRVALFPHHSWLHAEHHEFSSVACWRLRAVRELWDGGPIVPLGALLRSLGRTEEIRSGAPLRPPLPFEPLPDA